MAEGRQDPHPDGDEVPARTKEAFADTLNQITTSLDESIEAEKEKNDFLQGVPVIVAALKSGKITCRVYRKAKFHAKAYITHARPEVVGSSALVGSSNFTVPGLTKNLELNVRITGSPVSVLQEWYERHWENAEDVTPDILRVIERHVREYSPYEVYARSLEQLFSGYQQSVTDWESGYQVCHKWFPPGDRKGRTLSKDDIAHYQKIVVALSETIRLMKEIDAVIEKHGGWPGAFVTDQPVKL